MWTLELKGLIVTTVADPGEEPGRPGSPLIFRPNEAMKVWICHCSRFIELINFIREHYQKIQSSSVIWSLNMVYLQESKTRDKIMDLFMLLCLAN